MVIEELTPTLYNKLAILWSDAFQTKILQAMTEADARGNVIFCRHEYRWFQYMEVAMNYLNEEYFVAFIYDHDNWTKRTGEAQITSMYSRN